MKGGEEQWGKSHQVPRTAVHFCVIFQHIQVLNREREFSETTSAR